MVDYPALDITWIQDERTPALLDLVHACLDDFAPQAIEERDSGDGWRVFFRSTDARDAARHALAAAAGGRLTAIEPVAVPDDGWARRNQASLAAVRVGRVVVAPPWAPEASGDPGGDEAVVIIEPSMGFGTGHHATTRLCLRLLQELPVAGRRVADVGTGSGVLAISAWKLGAVDVVGIDCDPDALANAAENLRVNGAEQAVALVELDLQVLAAGRRSVEPADVVFANLTASTLERYAPVLDTLARAGGRLVVSGFAPGDLPDIERAFGRAAARTMEEGAWAAALFAARDATVPSGS